MSTPRRPALLLVLCAVASAATPPAPPPADHRMATAYASFPATAFQADGMPAWADTHVAAAANNGTAARVNVEGGAWGTGLLDVSHNFNMRPPCSVVGPL